MTVKEFIEATDYFKKHHNIKARLFIKFLKKEKQAYLLLTARAPSYKVCFREYIHCFIILSKYSYDDEEAKRYYHLQDLWLQFLRNHLTEQRKYVRKLNRLKSKRKLNGTAN